MKKKILFISLALMICLSSCQKVEQDIPDNKNPGIENTKNDNDTSEGIISDIYIENDIKYIELETKDGTEKLDASDLEDFGMYKKGQIIKAEIDNASDVPKILNIIVEKEPDTKEPDNKDKNKKIIKEETSIDLSKMNEYKKFDGEILSQYNLTKVSFYTDAGVDENGNLEWDDGNHFLLVAHTNDDSGFVLFDNRVQFADFKVNIFTEGDILKISLMDSGTASINFRVFEYVDGSFEETNAYTSKGNVNMIGNL